MTQHTPITPPIPPSIYFSGCGYGSIAYVGVYKAMLEIWGPNFMDKTIIAGDSAGVILVLGITKKMSPDQISMLYYNTGINSMGGIFNGGMNSLLTNTIYKLVDDEEIYKTYNNKICIGMSKWFYHHIWRTNWISNDDLIQTIKHSLYIPLLVPRNPKVDGCEVVDGAFCITGNDLPHQNNTLYIGDDPVCEISISMSLRQMIYPIIQQPDNKDMIDKGYNAFMKWVNEDGGKLKEKSSRQPKHMIQVLLWTLKIIEIIIEGIKNNLYY